MQGGKSSSSDSKLKMSSLSEKCVLELTCPFKSISYCMELTTHLPHKLRPEDPLVRRNEAHIQKQYMPQTQSSVTIITLSCTHGVAVCPNYHVKYLN